MGMDSDQFFGSLIDVPPDSQVAETAHGIIAAMRTALVFRNHRDTVGVVGVAGHSRGGIDGEFGVVAEFRARKPLGPVFVIQRSPFAGEVYLREDRQGY